MPILHSLRIESFKFSNFDQISSSAVQIYGLKEAHFSESAENMNSGDSFKGKNVLPKLQQVELLLACWGGGVVCYFKANFFLASSLCQVQKREEINVLVRELWFFVCVCLSNIFPSNCNRLQTNASRSVFPSVIVFQFSGMLNSIGLQ